MFNLIFKGWYHAHSEMLPLLLFLMHLLFCEVMVYGAPSRCQSLCVTRVTCLCLHLCTPTRFIFPSYLCYLQTSWKFIHIELMVLSPDGRVDGVSVGSFSIYHPGVWNVMHLLRLLIDYCWLWIICASLNEQSKYGNRYLNVCGKFSYKAKLLLMSVMQVWRWLHLAGL